MNRLSEERLDIWEGVFNHCSGRTTQHALHPQAIEDFKSLLSEVRESRKRIQTLESQLLDALKTNVSTIYKLAPSVIEEIRKGLTCETCVGTGEHGGVFCWKLGFTRPPGLRGCIDHEPKEGS